MKKLLYFFLLVTFEGAAVTFANKKKRSCFSFNSSGLCVTSCQEEPFVSYVCDSSLELQSGTLLKTGHQEEPHTEEEEEDAADEDREEESEDIVNYVFEEEEKEEKNKPTKKGGAKKGKKPTLLGYVLSKFLWRCNC